jgi:hypothetical protein
MATETFLRALVELATSDSLDRLLDGALHVIERDIGLRGRIELWDGDGTRFMRGESPRNDNGAHRTWIGVHYTVGAIELEAPPTAIEDVELLAGQLAGVAEQLIERETAQRRTIREDIDRLYDRRIRGALIRNDRNASAVARELRVSRGRVAKVILRWRKR